MVIWKFLAESRGRRLLPTNIFDRMELISNARDSCNNNIVIKSHAKHAERQRHHCNDECSTVQAHLCWRRDTHGVRLCHMSLRFQVLRLGLVFQLWTAHNCETSRVLSRHLGNSAINSTTGGDIDLLKSTGRNLGWLGTDVSPNIWYYALYWCKIYRIALSGPVLTGSCFGPRTSEVP